VIGFGEITRHRRQYRAARSVLRIPGGAGPATDCCLRNLAVGARRRAGPVNLAAAPSRPLAVLLGLRGCASAVLRYSA
jgi:hypothetical protein